MFYPPDANSVLHIVWGMAILSPVVVFRLQVPRFLFYVLIAFALISPIFIEIIQIFIDRTFDIMDILMSYSGSGVALIFAYLGKIFPKR